jgi:hypothetical protein
MTKTISESGLQRRDVGTRIIRLGDHDWGWMPLIDRSAVTKHSPAAVWEEYCFDARSYYLQNDWSGRKWKFALPVGDGNYDIHDVWDVKTGERWPVPHDAINGILLPAGWSKWMEKPAADLAEAVRKCLELTEGKTMGMIGSASAKPIEDKAWPILSEALASIRYSELDLAFAQMASAPDRLVPDHPSFDEPTSKVMVVFRQPTENWMIHNRMLVWIRVVLGELKLAQLSIYSH